MEQEMSSAQRSASHGYRVVIDEKLPSLNEYINKCRTNRYGAAEYKREIEKRIMRYFSFKPISKPVRILFTWQEANKRRDLDNVAFAKKFILDAMVKGGYLKDDNRRWVTGFTDEFVYGDKARVTLFITEVGDEEDDTKR